MPRRGGLKPKTFKGLSKKRIAKGSGAGKRVVFNKDEPTTTVQFLQKPAQMREFEVHTFQEEGRWNFVPCAGDDVCPLCDDESDDVRSVGYRFCCNVYNLKTRRVQILEGPKTLADKVFTRYERKPTMFLKRVWDVSRYPTTPVSYDMERAEEDAVDVSDANLLDLDQYLVEEMQRYYGEDLDIEPARLRDDDEDDEEDEDEDADGDDEDEDEDDDDDDGDDEDEEDEDADDDDDDEEGDDDEDDDEDEDEDEEPPPRRRRTTKRVAKKVTKRPAKRTVKKAAKRTIKKTAKRTRRT